MVHAVAVMCKQGLIKGYLSLTEWPDIWGLTVLFQDEIEDLEAERDDAMRRSKTLEQENQLLMSDLQSVHDTQQEREKIHQRYAKYVTRVCLDRKERPLRSIYTERKWRRLQMGS